MFHKQMFYYDKVVWFIPIISNLRLGEIFLLLLIYLLFADSLQKRTSSTALEQPNPYSAIPGLGPLPIIGGLHHFLPVIGLYYPLILCLTWHSTFCSLNGVMLNVDNNIMR